MNDFEEPPVHTDEDDQIAMRGLEVRLAADMAGDPEIMSRPRTVVPLTAFAGRLTLLAGAKKSGKSTYLTTAIAAVTAGRTLFGEAVEPPMVLWAALDEAEGDLLRRFQAAGGDLSRIYVASPPARSSQLLAAARALGVDILVVDTISDLAAGEIESENDNLQVKTLLAPFRVLGRQKHVAVILIHHATKTTGQSRGAGAFEDTADHIMTIGEVEGDDTVRQVKVRGRLAVDDFRFTWTEAGLEIPEREASTLSVVRAFVWARPGCKSGEVYDGVSRKREQVRLALAKLSATGEIENRGNARLAAWYLGADGNDLGKRRSGSLKPARVMMGNDPVTTLETPVVTAPPKGGMRETTQQGPDKQVAA